MTSSGAESVRVNIKNAMMQIRVDSASAFRSNFANQAKDVDLKRTSSRPTGAAKSAPIRSEKTTDPVHTYDAPAKYSAANMAVFGDTRRGKTSDRTWYFLPLR